MFYCDQVGSEVLSDLESAASKSLCLQLARFRRGGGLGDGSADGRWGRSVLFCIQALGSLVGASNSELHPSTLNRL